MKIGILTYHRSVNDGAVLQAYCVYKIFKKLFPNAKIEIIDYRPWRMEYMELKRLVTARRLKINIDQIRKFLIVRAFLKKQGVKFSNKHFTSDDTQKSIEFIANQNYDLIVCGSDTIWEMRDDGNVPAPPNVYFLPDLNNVKKIAFAASADPVNLKHPFIQSLSFSTNGVKEAISDFDLVYVRDNATQDLINERIQVRNTIHKIPDPSLLCDFSEIIGEESSKKNTGRRSAGIALSSKKLRKWFTTFLTNLNYEVYNLLGKPVENQLQLKGKTVEERLANFKILDLLISDRFHGSILSFKINHSPVIFIEDSNKWEGHNSKGRDLFTSLDFGEFILRLDPETIPNESTIDDLISKWEQKKYLIPVRLKEIRNLGLKKISLIRSVV